MSRDEALAIARAGARGFTSVDLEAAPLNAFEDEKVWLLAWIGLKPLRHVKVAVHKSDRDVFIVFPNSCREGVCNRAGTAPRMTEQAALAVARAHDPKLISDPARGPAPTGSWQSDKAWAFYWAPPDDACGGGTTILIDKRTQEVVGLYTSQ
jgi:hypothetical protein